MYVATDIQAVLLQGESLPSGRNSPALITAQHLYALADPSARLNPVTGLTGD